MTKIYQSGKIGFGRAIKDFFKGYFNFSGRTTRSGFWFASLFLAIIFIPVLMLFGATQVALQSVPNLNGNETFFNPFLYLIFFMSIGVIFPVLAMLARRMRDTGMKGYSILVFLILTVALKIAGMIFQFLSNPALNFSFFILSFFFLVAFFIFSLLPTDHFLGEEKAKVEPDLQGWSVNEQGRVISPEN